MKIRQKLRQSAPLGPGSQGPAGEASHKVVRTSKAKENRKIYLSWVPDDKGYVLNCVRMFRKKLEHYDCDQHGKGLSVLETPHAAAGDIQPWSMPAGGRKSEAMRCQELDDVTDFVAILCDDYLTECVKGVGSAGYELPKVLHSKYVWEEHAEDPSAYTTHVIWAAPAVKVNLRGLRAGAFSFKEERYRRWWHYFKGETERFRTGPDEHHGLEDDVFEAIEALLQHHPSACHPCTGSQGDRPLPSRR